MLLKASNYLQLFFQIETAQTVTVQEQNSKIWLHIPKTFLAKLLKNIA